VPVLQLSIDAQNDDAFHLALARRLAPLRDRGALIIGSGNILHTSGRRRYASGRLGGVAGSRPGSTRRPTCDGVRSSPTGGVVLSWCGRDSRYWLNKIFIQLK
jgi:hypothetical protein